LLDEAAWAQLLVRLDQRKGVLAVVPQPDREAFTDEPAEGAMNAAHYNAKDLATTDPCKR